MKPSEDREQIRDMMKRTFLELSFGTHLGRGSKQLSPKRTIMGKIRTQKMKHILIMETSAFFWSNSNI